MVPGASCLGRHTTTDDVVFGSTVSGRPPELEGIESILGMFINNLPVRLRMPPAAGLTSWLTELQGRLTEMRLLEWTAPEQIQEWCDLPAGLRLFDSLVIFQNYPVEEPGQKESSAGLEIVSFHSRMETSYLLTVVAGPLQPLGLRILYDTRWYDAATVERLLGQLRAVLLGMAEGAARTLSELPVLTPAEHRQMEEWNASPAPEGRLLHRRILDHTRSAPDQIAVEMEGASATWGDLERRAGRLAHELAAAGVGEGDRVAVRVASAPDLAVALLGVLTAGAAFVPVESLDATLQGLGVTALVADAAGPEPGIPVRTIRLGVEEQPGESICRNVSGALPACVLPGSAAGSAPAELSHAALARTGASLERLWPLRGDDAVLVLPGRPWQVALDVLAALALGARAVLAGPGEAGTGERLAGLLPHPALLCSKRLRPPGHCCCGPAGRGIRGSRQSFAESPFPGAWPISCWTRRPCCSIFTAPARPRGGRRPSGSRPVRRGSTGR